MMRPTLIFDLDGTLVRCREFYEAAIAQFGACAADRLGVPATAAEDLVRQIDLHAIKSSGSWMRSRWPRSFRAASLALDAMAGRDPDMRAAKLAEDIAEATFYAPYPLYEGAREVLEQYRTAGWALLLYTKGDEAVQYRKVTINRLHEVFEEVVITPRKDAARLAALCVQQRVLVADSWMIGDSRRDDIAPALSTGLSTVQVMTSTWEYDRTEHIAHVEIDTVAELPRAIPLYTPAGKVVKAGR